MDFFDVILQRRSIRKFKDTPVTEETIAEILKSAQWAPSHCNTQGWRFIIVDNQQIKKGIVDNGGSPVIAKAPVGILTCYCSRTDNEEYSDWIQSASAAIENMTLAAHALGLGSCWICHLPTRPYLRKLFNIPAGFSPVGYLALGYPAHTPSPVPRKNTPADLYAYNTFPTKGAALPQNTPLVRIKAFARKIYYIMPSPLKKIINPLVNRLFVKKFNN